MKYLANTILISAKPNTKPILDRIGGIGAKVEFRTVAFGSWDDQIWAVKVEPVPVNTPIHTGDAGPVIILGHRRTCKPIEVNRICSWEAIPPSHEGRLTFTTTIGERAFLKI